MLLSGWLGLPIAGQTTADVTLHVHVHGAAALPADAPAVVWLTPLDAAIPLTSDPPRVYRMSQHNKQFVPHLLVVPVGSRVEFPNLDPFFHNVFSQFNGRRFDLGLYETGKSQGVQLPREGVSYIFCNIHPEMGGVIVSLGTPFFTVAKTSDVVLHHVPSGSYRLQVWNERATPESLRAAERVVDIGPVKSDLGRVDFDLSHPYQPDHMNKFGEPYRP